MLGFFFFSFIFSGVQFTNCTINMQIFITSVVLVHENINSSEDFKDFLNNQKVSSVAEL